ncbi:unnamed protein product [Trichogramma brassicae]|uniref:Uncharacterized protein n=1 Tax=Trichogramma brassicae TaxID=86971 RepID=A0A6H5HUD0_9HYME|nr:unnamed protein product [Trichogramma brassicae]
MFKVKSKVTIVKYLREVTPYFRKASIIQEVGWELQRGFLSATPPPPKSPPRADTRYLPLQLCRLTRSHPSVDPEMHDLVEPIFKISEERHRPLQVDAVDNSGRTPLHRALAHSADKHSVPQWYLLEENGRIDSWSNNDRLVVRRLLENGADPNLAVCNEDGFTPLHVICQRDQVYIFRGKPGIRTDGAGRRSRQVGSDAAGTGRGESHAERGRPLSKSFLLTKFFLRGRESLLDHGADLSGFVFPDESRFVERSDKYGDIRYTMRLKLMRVARALIVVERLEKRGYELAQSDVLTIMRIFDKRGSLPMSADLDKYSWFNDEELASIAKGQTMGPNLSLYDFLQLSPEQAEKRLAFTDYFRFANSNTWYEIPEGPCLACIAHLFEIMLGRFFRGWALESFSLVTRNELPILCCEKIVRQSKVRDLWCLFQAATGQN